jgi:hypothetical protein
MKVTNVAALRNGELIWRDCDWGSTARLTSGELQVISRPPIETG